MIGQLLQLGVRMYPNTTATGWANGALSVVRSDTTEDIAGRSLLAVTTRLPDHSLSAALEVMGVKHRMIGDMDAPGTVQSTVFSGHRHAREILGQELVPGGFRRERLTLFHPAD